MKFVNTISKKCSKCQEIKAICEFGKDVTKVDFLSIRCKPCNRGLCRAYHEKNRDKKSEYNLKQAQKNPYQQWAKNCISAHKHNGFDVDLSSIELVRIATETLTCKICDQLIDWSYGVGQKWNGPSLDRLDNGKSLDHSNTIIICRSCNVTKRNRTFNEFVQYCKNIAEKFDTQTLNGDGYEVCN
jgi:hypothetical protein